MMTSKTARQNTQKDRQIQHVILQNQFGTIKLAFI